MSRIYINNCTTRCNTKQSIYYSASSFYVFRCQPHPSSGVHKTVTTAADIGHILFAATSLQRGQVRTWNEVAAQKKPPPHLSSGIHKIVTTASGTGHIFCAATSLQRGQVGTWPRWCEVVTQKN